MQESYDPGPCTMCGEPVDVDNYYQRGNAVVCKWCHSDSAVANAQAQAPTPTYRDDQPQFTYGRHSAGSDFDVMIFFKVLSWVAFFILLAMRCPD